MTTFVIQGEKFAFEFAADGLKADLENIRTFVRRPAVPPTGLFSHYFYKRQEQHRYIVSCITADAKNQLDKILKHYTRATLRDRPVTFSDMIIDSERGPPK